MASRIRGGERFKVAMQDLPQLAQDEIMTAFDEGIRIVQQTAVATAPVSKGRLRGALASPDAVARLTDRVGVEFGLLTDDLKSRAVHLLWVEFGTKGYRPGDQRRAGKDKHGRQMFRRIKRAIPARPARPVMRPAIDVNRQRIRDLVETAIRKALARSSRG